MATEIEKKFLIHPNKWIATPKPEGQWLLQGYLFEENYKSCRVRIAGNRAWINIKKMQDALHRLEFEYEIPVPDATDLLNELSISRIEKTRYNIPFKGHLWEVDVFAGANEGLIVAEIELKHADADFEKPDWVADEVTYDVRYLNTQLAQHPFSSWTT
jgi:CYTH domain-containing protein